MVSLFSPYHLASFRMQRDARFILGASKVTHLKHTRLSTWCISSKSDNSPDSDVKDMKKSKKSVSSSKISLGAPRRARKKVDTTNKVEGLKDIVTRASEGIILETSPVATKKVTKRGRKKATASSNLQEELKEKKLSKSRSKRSIDTNEEDNAMKDPSENTEKPESLDFASSNVEELLIEDVEDSAMKDSPKNSEKPESLDFAASNVEELLIEDGEDISYTYSWPPLVCCFGAAQYAFLPSGRPANRLIDHKIHESMRDMFWSPTNFVRAPGGPSSSVAVALAVIGGRVAFMGELGDDELGQNMLYYLNANNVQTRSIKLDSSKPTALSHMKITKRGGLKMTCAKPCAEDSLLISEVNIDVLREAKMFYFNSSSLLDESMRSTTLQAINISKKFGGAIFFDVNLPLPLWNSIEETKAIIQQAWNAADIIEVTKQELEFLCGINCSEKFDTADNHKSKFIHHKPEQVMQLWHKNLQVLFVTNGTTKIHYYTEKASGCVRGMEDPPITPYTGDMSASGDAIVAALMRMLTVQPHLTTDKDYLEHMIKYAIDCGVIDQWLLARIRGFPPKEGLTASQDEQGRIRSISEREHRTVEQVVS